jgi:hypothetical protein
MKASARDQSMGAGFFAFRMTTNNAAAAATTATISGHFVR